jgi:large subunit ribosomal protein L1
MARKISKRFKSALQSADLVSAYPLKDAIATLAKFPKANFDETVEISAHLGVDPRQSSQMVRGTVSLPNGSGKQVVVAVFTDNEQEAKDAGADFVGMSDLIAKVQEGWMDFDVAIATPAAMKEVRKIARVLGPRGLMPNPKSGTVTDDIANAIKEVKGGRVEYKMDKTANIAVIIGKRSFAEDKLLENALTALESIKKAKPEAFKGGKFIKTAALSSTMSPGVKIEAKELATA